MKLLKNGNILMLCSALLFSTGGMMIKMLPEWPALAINGVRCGIAGFVILVYLKKTGGRVKITKGTLTGAFCISATTNLYMVANKLTTAANAILIQFASPIFIIFFMWLLFKERPRRLDVITCIAVFSGIAFFVMDGLGSGRMLGNMLALFSGVTYAGVFMMNRIPGGDSYSAAVMGHFASGLIGLPVILQQRNFDPGSITLLLALGLFQMGLGYVCFCAGIKKTAPVSACLISGVEPVMNPLLVGIVVGERMTPVSVIGGVIVLGSVTVYNVLLARMQPKPQEVCSEERLEEMRAEGRDALREEQECQ